MEWSKPFPERAVRDIDIMHQDHLGEEVEPVGRSICFLATSRIQALNTSRMRSNASSSSQKCQYLRWNGVHSQEAACRLRL